MTVNRKPTSDNELACKKYIDESIGGDLILKFIQLLQICSKVSVENDV